MRFIDENTIELDKVINELDIFVFDFVKILEKYMKYVIISGYVSILFGRSRATEDIDLFIEKVDKKKFNSFYQDLKQNGYWCLNAEEIDDIYDYLNDGLAVRFAKKGESIPNFEIKFAKRTLDFESLNKPLIVITKIGKINISPFEIQIAFKKYYLKSDKDLEDSKHIEELFKGKINKEKVLEYKKIIENET